MGGGSPTTHAPLNNASSLSRQTMLPLGAFHASLHSRSLCCVCAANSTPLPRSILPTPHFSTQPLPASEILILGRGMADSQGGFGTGSTQVPGAHVGGGNSGLRGRGTCSDGSPTHCSQRLKKPAAGERVCNGGSAPLHTIQQ